MRGYSEFVFETPYAREIYQALLPELDDDLHRSSVALDCSDGFIRLEVKGDDVVSLRAALNTWIRLVKIAFEMVSL